LTCVRCQSWSGNDVESGDPVRIEVALLSSGQFHPVKRLKQGDRISVTVIVVTF
jgi:hypothetical protein